VRCLDIIYSIVYVYDLVSWQHTPLSPHVSSPCCIHYCSNVVANSSH